MQREAFLAEIAARLGRPRLRLAPARTTHRRHSRDDDTSFSVRPTFRKFISSARIRQRVFAYTQALLGFFRSSLRPSRMAPATQRKLSRAPPLPAATQPQPRSLASGAEGTAGLVLEPPALVAIVPPEP